MRETQSALITKPSGNNPLSNCCLKCSYDNKVPIVLLTVLSYLYVYFHSQERMEGNVLTCFIRYISPVTMTDVPFPKRDTLQFPCSPTRDQHSDQYYNIPWQRITNGLLHCCDCSAARKKSPCLFLKSDWLGQCSQDVKCHILWQSSIFIISWLTSHYSFMIFYGSLT